VESDMNLNETDIKRFYNIWFNLLDYTNEIYRVNTKVKNIANSDKVNPQDIAPLREKLWENNDILELEFLLMLFLFHLKVR
jgi:hypothetical protein